MHNMYVRYYDTMDNNVLPISLMNQLLIYGASYVIPEFHAEISYFSPCSWFLFQGSTSNSRQIVSEVGTDTDGDQDSFFQTALQIQIETAEGPPNRDIGKPEETDDRQQDVKMSKALQLMKATPISSVTTRSHPEDVPSDLLQTPGTERRPSLEPMVDITKAFTVNKIAKTLLTNQKTRLQNLEETGNFTINIPLKKFNPSLVQTHLHHILSTALKHVQYEPNLCRHLSKTLSEEARDVVKALKFPRYKFVSVVTIGQLKNASIKLCSRSVWDCTTDSYACAEYRNSSLHAVAMIFAAFLD